MPTYQYRCDRCGERFDQWQSFSDDTLTTCPSSGGPDACVAPGAGEVHKIFASVGITFKGDGFYKNDYGSNSSGLKKEKAAASSGSKGSSGSNGSNGSSGSNGSNGSDGSSASNGSNGSGTSDTTTGSSTGSKTAPSTKTSTD